MVSAGTFLVTTDPAPTMALRPTVTPHITVTLEPSEAPSSITVSSRCQSASVCGLPSGLVARGSLSLIKVTLWPTKTLSWICTPSHACFNRIPASVKTSRLRSRQIQSGLRSEHKRQAKDARQGADRAMAISVLLAAQYWRVSLGGSRQDKQPKQHKDTRDKSTAIPLRVNATKSVSLALAAGLAGERQTKRMQRRKPMQRHKPHKTIAQINSSACLVGQRFQTFLPTSCCGGRLGAGRQRTDQRETETQSTTSKLESLLLAQRTGCPRLSLEKV